LEAAFVARYEIFPKKKKRQDAKRAFVALIKSDAITVPDLMERTRLFAAYRKSLPEEKQQFTPYPASWLRSGEYADEIEQPRRAAAAGGSATVIKLEAPTQAPETFTEADWIWRLDQHATGKGWAAQFWGPAPGQPGCLVPEKLLQGASV